MLLNAIFKTLSQLFSPPFRSVLWKSIGFTLALLCCFWLLLQAVSDVVLFPLFENVSFFSQYQWITSILAWILGAGLVLAMGFLIAPVTSVFAGVFLDEIAERVEQKYYPYDKPGEALNMMQSVGIAMRFLGLVLLGNFIALLLVVFLGAGFVIFFLLNGYLLGREYFQFAALRHRSLADVEALRERHKGKVFIAGLVIACVLLVPVLNLLTPLFAGSLMVHVYKALDR